jgi:PAS domain S-box-containing protein
VQGETAGSVTRRIRVIVAVVVGIAAIPAAYLLSRENYLVFHSLVEISGIAILSGVFVISWNARYYPGNAYLQVVGNTALATSLVLLFHVLAYDGMGVFLAHTGPNTATQTWVASRYLLAGGLLAAPLFVGKGRVHEAWTLAGLGVTAGLLAAIFTFDAFPDAFVAGSGLTDFKVVSEYVVILALAAGGYLLWRRRRSFAKDVVQPVFVAIGLLMAAELSFTLYTDVYGVSNFTGHVFQAAAFVLFYVAMIRTGIRDPMKLTFRDLERDRQWLALQNRRFQQMLDELPLPYQSLDEDGRFITVNEAWTATFGYSRDEAVGRSFGDLVVEEQRDRFPERFETFKSIGKVDEVHWDLRCKDGSIVSTGIMGRVSKDATGRFARTHCVVTSANEAVGLDADDIADRDRELAERTRELEEYTSQLAEANRTKSAFLANMSHELRTPLNAVIGFSGVMLQGLTGELSEEQQRQLEMIDRSGKHLLAIVDDLLDLSKIEAGAVEVDLEETDLLDLCRECLAAVALDAEEKGLTLRLEEDVERRPELAVVLVDAGKVRQILLNLLGNALKFTERGEVRLEIDCDEREALAIRVVDTGPGIASEDHERIFDEFEQAGDRAAAKPRGTGLGLAISRRLARALGGDLTVTSAVGEGSAFTLLLPLRYGTTEIDDGD